jgi:hypothetical protein
MAEKAGTVQLPRLDVQTMRVRIVGDSPLISHAWSEKAKRAMLGKQMKQAKGAKEAKDPFRDYVESLYWISDLPSDPTPETVAAGRFGFPTVAFKAAAIGACRFVEGIKMTEARGAFHIIGDLAEIKGAPEMREDMVRVGMGTADIRYRGEFREWETELQVRFNAGAFSADQIVNLLNVAGFAQGVGEWRPERGGSFGMFHVG